MCRELFDAISANDEEELQVLIELGGPIHAVHEDGYVYVVIGSVWVGGLVGLLVFGLVGWLLYIYVCVLFGCLFGFLSWFS